MVLRSDAIQAFTMRNCLTDCLDTSPYPLKLHAAKQAKTSKTEKVVQSEQFQSVAALLL